MAASDKLIINAAITGTVLTKANTPFLPVMVSEIVDCAQRVREAGAAIVHLHARNPDETPCYDGNVYREIVERIREKTDLVVCVSLSGRFTADLEQRSAALLAKPDLASLTLGSMNFITQPSINSPETIRALAARIYAAHVVPELEVFEAGFINLANYLIRKGVLKRPHYVNILLGSLGSAPLDLVGLGHMVGMLPPGTIWSVAGIGQYQLDANVMGIAAGGHVRVGLEDNIYFDRDRHVLADNAMLVARVARIATDMGRQPAAPHEARDLIGLTTPAAAMPVQRLLSVS